MSLVLYTEFQIPRRSSKKCQLGSSAHTSKASDRILDHIKNKFPLNLEELKILEKNLQIEASHN